ncbi:MAG: DUF192 domain-containing protein [Alphaproteobacteria bacterium]
MQFWPAIRTLVLVAIVALPWPQPVSACPNPPQPELPRSPLLIETATGRHGFSVEIARSATEQACGLMLRQRLGHGEGMLFVYQPPREAWMWMHNTPIPLDMIYVAPNGRIVHIIPDTTPFSMETLGTHETVSGVLEVRAGTAARLGIRVGDRVRHQAFGVGG